MFETVIWLLYGQSGLDALNSQVDDVGTNETIYYSVERFTNTARINTIVSGLMEEILAGDPECNGTKATALRDIITLIRDQLLVVKLPNSDAGDVENCRIDAAMLETELSRIMHTANKEGDIYLCTGTRQKPSRLPASLQERDATAGAIDGPERQPGLVKAVASQTASLIPPGSIHGVPPTGPYKRDVS